MFPIPEWAPSAHPLIVHFPIAIFFIAALADVLAMILKRHVWLRWTASALYALGAVSALVAFFTGRSAADSVFPSAAASTVLTDHAEWATRTVWFYGLYAVGRLLVEWRRYGNVRAVQAALFVVGAAGLFLIVETGEHGAQMVYQHGLGVANVEPQTQRMFGHEDHAYEEEAEHEHGEHHHDVTETAEGEEHMHGDDDAHGEAEHMHSESDAHMHDDAEMSEHMHAEGEEHAHGEHHHEEIEATPKGVWTWHADHDGIAAFKQQFRLIQGNWSDVQPAVAHDDSGEEVVTLQTSGSPFLFVSEPPIGSLQYDLRLNLDGFKGTVRLVHHVHDGKNYNFIELSSAQVRLGRVVNGEVRIEDSGSASNKGWIAVRVVSDGGHFRGYIGTKLVGHGHGSEPTPGLVGLYAEGTGLLKVNAFEVRTLR